MFVGAKTAESKFNDCITLNNFNAVLKMEFDNACY